MYIVASDQSEAQRERLKRSLSLRRRDIPAYTFEAVKCDNAWWVATTVALGGLMGHDLGTQDKPLMEWISLRPCRPRTNDRDDMGSATSSSGNNSRCPIQQRHRIDAASVWTAMIDFILHR